MKCREVLSRSWSRDRVRSWSRDRVRSWSRVYPFFLQIIFHEVGMSMQITDTQVGNLIKLKE